MKTTFETTRFITVFFDSGYGISDQRKNLCLAFCTRYPDVHLITNIEDMPVDNQTYIQTDTKGFIDYHLINQYLEFNKPDSLVIIDSDLVLEDHFFESMKRELKNSDIVQGFDDSSELVNGQIYPASVKGIISVYQSTKRFRGHSGYIWGYNNKALKAINYTFPENFFLGGFDWYLANCIYGFPKFFICDTTYNFYTQIEDLKFSWIKHRVLHCYHGDKRKRQTPWHNYKQSIMKEFFSSQ